MIHSCKTLAIIGAGAAGTAAFIMAVKKRVAETIYIVDPKMPGHGNVFTNMDDDVLSNTTVNTTSIVSDNPFDFLHYLNYIGYKVTGDSFVPRRLVGKYIKERFTLYERIAKKRGSR